jgi:DNA helicase-2/ATP-dependent DNA helicase PcrA
MTLEQSYRTTVEIMDTANIVSDTFKIEGIPQARPVIRHGSEVSRVRADSAEDAARRIDALVEGYVNAGCKSIAIICKTLKECSELKKRLLTSPRVLTGGEDDFAGGVQLIPSYLVKGLEFDAVIVANASAEVYGNNELDAKLLYVAMTRPLHELAVVYVGELTGLLSPNAHNLSTKLREPSLRA